MTVVCRSVFNFQIFHLPCVDNRINIFYLIVNINQSWLFNEFHTICQKIFNHSSWTSILKVIFIGEITLHTQLTQLIRILSTIHCLIKNRKMCVVNVYFRGIDSWLQWELTKSNILLKRRIKLEKTDDKMRLTFIPMWLNIPKWQKYYYWNFNNGKSHKTRWKNMENKSMLNFSMYLSFCFIFSCI